MSNNKEILKNIIKEGLSTPAEMSAAYSGKINSIMKMIDEIRNEVRAKRSDNRNWGDVGDIGYIEEKLRDVRDKLLNIGAYEEESPDLDDFNV
jgi:hypothetical protein